MKGITLGTDMIIIIVIAATVLIVLLVFFQTTGGEGIDHLNTQQDRSQMCRIYTSKDPDCTGSGTSAIGLDIQNDLNNVIKVCKNLGGYPCDDTSNVEGKRNCVRSCCSFMCLKGPNDESTTST